jgi:excisionase family DNA binding protein
VFGFLGLTGIKRAGMESEEWITTTEACEISGYHPDHLRRVIRAGGIEARKFGIVWQVKRVSLLEYLRWTESQGKRRGPKPRKM